ncbi:MAG: hypothetical protein GY757_17105 [bacterium]|nr:hypothetical protein [bacterium]
MTKIENNLIVKSIIIIVMLFILQIWAPVTMEAQTYGNTWSNGNVSKEIVFRDVCFTGTSFVTVGDSAVVYTSSNGSSWTARSSGYPAAQYAHLFAVTSGEGKVVAVGRDKLIVTSSNDGVTWTTTNARTNDVYDEDITGVAYGNGIFVAVGEAGGTWRSADGNSWTESSFTYSSRGIAFGNGLFLAAMVNGKVYQSTDGVSWTSKSVGQHLTAIHYGNGMWVAVGSKIWTSTNGSTWTMRLDISNCNYMFYSVTSAPGSFVAAGENGVIVNSADGITWRQPSSGSMRIMLGAAYGNNRVVTVSNGGPRSPNSLYLYSTHYSDAGGTVPSVFSGCGSANNDTLRVIAPNGGEILTPGGSYNIRWTSTGDVGNVKLWYSSDNGANYNKFEHSTANDGSYSWAVPSIESTKCFIRVSETADGNVDDYSNSAFTISSSGGDTITVTSPNGGETLEPGTQHVIRWTSTGSVGTVKLWYSTTGLGTSWTKFENAVTNDGSYTWTVPNDPSTNCYVRVSETSNGNVDDYSDAAFTIGTSSTVTLTSPNGGEVWEAGSSYNVTWTSDGDIDNVKLEYTLDNMVTWNPLRANTTNDGSHTWTTPSDVTSDICRIRVSEVSNSSNTDRSDGLFEIKSPSSITVTSPIGGESLMAGSTHNITWNSTGTISTVKIEYTSNNGSSWNTIRATTTNDGSYAWSIPDVDSTTCLVRISDSAYPTVTDNSNSNFSISSASLTLVAPNGGELWTVGSTQYITWSSGGSVGNIKLEYTTNSGSSWNTIVSSTGDDESYTWTVPDTPSSNCKVRISPTSGSAGLVDTSNSNFSIGAPSLAVDKTSMNFGYSIGGTTPAAQTLLVSNSGGGSMSWTASTATAWIGITPASGTGSASVAVTVSPSGMSAGDYSGTIAVTAPTAENSPQTVTINLSVIDASDDEPPFGQFASPAEGLAGSGSVPVTGWALDDTGVQKVTIYYNNGSVMGDAIFVEGARSDLEVQYPGYPQNSQAGWGYMLLTNSLPDGNYYIYAIATDLAGHTVTLGGSNITINNASAVTPFGAIDYPAQGGIASGTHYEHWGWTLTPTPNTIPFDGSTIKVWIDGASLGTVSVYNSPSAGIKTLFPGYNNSDGPMGFRYIDTTGYDNGVHIISWTVKDDANNQEGIGSRYFSIANTGSDRATAQNSIGPSYQRVSQLENIPHAAETLKITTGYNKGTPVPNKTHDQLKIELIELEPLEITVATHMNPEAKVTVQPIIEGYLVVKDELRRLPIGSTLDAKTGTFYWQPGPGFIGNYQLVFVEKYPGGKQLKKEVRVQIVPRANTK